MKKNVIFSLNSISVNAEGATEQELLEHAKEQLIEQLKKQFPHYTYTINELDALTFGTVKVGMIVETTKGIKGIVSAVNKKTINVTLSSGRRVQGAPQGFKQSIATFAEARSIRPNEKRDDWYEGDSGYLLTPNGIQEVVVGKSPDGKYKIYLINENNPYYTLIKSQLNDLLSDEKEKLLGKENLML